MCHSIFVPCEVIISPLLLLPFSPTRMQAPSPASTPAEDVPSTSSETRYSSSSNHPPPLSRRDDATSLPKDSSAPCIGSRIRVRGVFQDGQENSTTTAQKASGLDSPKVKRHKAHFRGMPVSTSIQVTLVDFNAIR